MAHEACLSSIKILSILLLQESDTNCTSDVYIYIHVMHIKDTAHYQTKGNVKSDSCVLLAIVYNYIT